MKPAQVFWNNSKFFNFNIGRETVQTKDQGQISLDWVCNDDNNKLYPDAETRPTVVVLPGITGLYFHFYLFINENNFVLFCFLLDMLISNIILQVAMTLAMSAIL